MHRIGHRTPGIALATILAGPFFLASYALATLYAELPAPLTLDQQVVETGLFLLFPAMIVGGVIAFLPNLIGTLILCALADERPWAQARVVWAIVGGVTGLAAALCLPDGDAGASIALVATSAICAMLCRGWLRWTD